MIQLGLSSGAQRALLKTLATEHIISCTLSLMDLDHKPLGRIQGQILEGQVNYDAKVQVSRQLQVTITDPRRKALVDHEDGSPRLNRMIRVHYNVWVPGYEWISIPVFTGPITSTSRNSEEGTLSIEAMGKQYLSKGPTEEPRTFAKGRNRVATIRTILHELAGETRFKLPTGWSAKLAKKISMSRESSAWSYATIIARSMNAQLYYDGWGNVRLRKVPVRPSFTFRSGKGEMIVDLPVETESSEDLFNKSVVTGAIPKGRKSPLVGRAALPPNHRYSPQSLKRGGRIKNYIIRIDDDSLRTQKEVDDAAERAIERVQVAQRYVTFTSLPMPLLEEGDLIVVDTEEVQVTAPMDQMSLPLRHDGVSTIGYLDKVSYRKKKTKLKKR